MIALLQRVRHASVAVEEHTIAGIQAGILVFAAIEKADDRRSCRRMAERILSYRLFCPADTRRMRHSVADVGGEVLLVPQFTLAADTRKGTRASFSSSCPAEQAAVLFAHFVDVCQELHGKTVAGRFAAEMQVSLLNEGPVTFILRSSGG